jgi:GntR family transcriptional regulator
VILTIDTRDRRPIYQQVADGIRALIAGGHLTEGQPLPSVRQMAADLGVNLNTIAAAYRELSVDGLIAVKHGSGAVVAPRTVSRQTGEQLRTPLRTALTQMILAGLHRNEILDMVKDELKTLAAGVKL